MQPKSRSAQPRELVSIVAGSGSSDQRFIPRLGIKKRLPEVAKP